MTGTEIKEKNYLSTSFKIRTVRSDCLFWHTLNVCSRFNNRKKKQLNIHLTNGNYAVLNRISYRLFVFSCLQYVVFFICWICRQQIDSLIQKLTWSIIWVHAKYNFSLYYLLSLSSSSWSSWMPLHTNCSPLLIFFSSDYSARNHCTEI